MPISSFFSTQGKIGRQEYFAKLMTIGIFALLVLPLGGEVLKSLNHDEFFSILFLIDIIIFVWAKCCITIRRLNDLNRHKLLTLLIFFPGVNLFFTLYLCLMPGDVASKNLLKFNA